MGKKTSDFGVLGGIVLLPVLLLAGVAVWGLSAQRRAVLADAQGQARAVAQRLSGRLDEELARLEQGARFTEGIRMPVPGGSAAKGEMKALHAAMEGKSVEALKRLAWGEEGRGNSEAGLPVFVLAALAGLELDPLVPEFFSSVQVERTPSVLTEKWLLRLEEKVALLREPGVDELSVEHPYYLCRLNAAHAREYWAHDEWVRRAFWDRGEEAWRTREPGAHVIGEEVFWVCRPQAVTKYSRSPQREDAMAVLTEDDLAQMLAFGVAAELPGWMGVSVLLEDRALHAVPKHPVKGVSLVLEGGKATRVAEGVRVGGTEWLDMGRGDEVLASAQGIFRVVTTLREPRVLYAPSDRMAKWAGWMLATAVLTAATGLWMIRRALRQERRLGELKSQFVSSVSHELRAPVGSLRLMAEGLASGRVRGEAAQEFYRLMAGEGARLSALIENVLDFARIEQGRKSYQMRETDVAGLLGDAVGLMRPQAEARGLRVELACEGLPFVPRVDAGALQQAVINLLDNAIKFTGESGGVIEVRLAADVAGGGWSVTVTDPGMGIAEAEHGRIFELFHRLGNELRRETTGTGIGLAIVKHVAEGHGGVVSVVSAPGRGSRFRLEFPGPAGAGDGVVSSQEEVDKGGEAGDGREAS